MRWMITALALVSIGIPQAGAQEESKNLHQYYSGKIGFFAPDKRLNNGLLFGLDGITEFVHYDFFLSAALDVYFKRTFNFFDPPPPQVRSQSLVLLPLHASIAYRLLHAPKADTRGYVGIGAGYYLYFYSVDYRTSSGGIIGTVLSDRSETKNGGNVVASLFARIVIGKVFVEPRLYLAAKAEGRVEDSKYLVDPSGFAIALGVQY